MGQERPRVKLDMFEGPLDLLLHLVKKNEVEITDIPIAAITDQYLAYLEMLHSLDLDVAGEYLVMAATLLHIKSRALLPAEELGEEEEEGEEDPRARLVQQLLEYQRYREAAEELARRALLERDVFTRGPAAEEGDGAEEAPPLRASLGELLDALAEVLRRTSLLSAHAVSAEEVSLTECLCALLDLLKERGDVTFFDVFPPAASRARIVTTFVAVLELVRARLIRVDQGDLFGTIRLSLAVAPQEASLPYDAS
jgi:segregation and condensation protein A